MADLHAMYAEADALKEAGKYPEAIEKLHEILAEDETFVMAHLALAVLYSKVEQHDRAVAHAQRACEIEPNEPFNFTAMSVTYQRAWQGTGDARMIQLAEAAMARAHALEGRG